MGTGFTWVAIAASLAMALAAVCVFGFAVLRGYFRNIEDTKYQVFWSDPDDRAGGGERDDHERATTPGDASR